jgi:hypothetical protein
MIFNYDFAKLILFWGQKSFFYAAKMFCKRIISKKQLQLKKILYIAPIYAITCKR